MMLVDSLPPLRSNQHLRPRDQQAAHKKQPGSRPLPQTLTLRRLRVCLYCIWQWQYLGSQHTRKTTRLPSKQQQLQSHTGSQLYSGVTFTVEESEDNNRLVYSQFS